MLKQRFVLILFACLTIVGLVACGTSGTSGSASNGTPESAKGSTPTHATTPPSSSPSPFRVTSIDVSVSPSSIAGMTCNSNVTLTYTVTFHVAANSPGGKIQFMYTTNNGRASTNGSVTADAGQTTVVYTFTNTGVLYSDHTFPGIAEVITSSPNQVNSPQVKPTGQCS
jgi:hypothetical protein